MPARHRVANPALVFAQSKAKPCDVAALKQTLAKLGKLGCGTKDLARCGAPSADGLAASLAAAAETLAF